MSSPSPSKRWPSEHDEDAAASPAAANVVPIRVDADDDPLESFAPESAPLAAKPRKTARRRTIESVKSTTWLAAAVGVSVGAATLIAIGAGFYSRGRVGGQPAPQVSPLVGRAVLNSRPDGAVVIIDGAARGVTPLELELSAGSHDVIFRADAAERRIVLMVDGGTRVSENVDLPVVATSFGTLEVASEPAGARVTVDGASVGVTPLTVRNVSPARHAVAVTQGSAVVSKTVEVVAGTTASVFISLSQAAASTAPGTLVVESPLELRILENGQLLGLSNAAPIVLASGKHQLDFVNEALELRLNRTVTVDGGKSTHLSVPIPNGTLSVNASPWAEVFIDGRSVGVTPLGAISLPIGTHDVVWRHPQLGEKRRSVTVGAQTPTRVSMDLSK